MGGSSTAQGREDGEVSSVQAGNRAILCCQEQPGGCPTGRSSSPMVNSYDGQDDDHVQFPATTTHGDTNSDSTVSSNSFPSRGSYLTDTAGEGF